MRAIECGMRAEHILSMPDERVCGSDCAEEYGIAAASLYRVPRSLPTAR